MKTKEADMIETLHPLKVEFDRWAREGRGEGMAEAHRAVTDIIIDMMGLRPDSRVLDLGCGIGWATRLLGRRVPEGRAVGLDISEEMIKLARECGNDPSNVEFRVLKDDCYPFHDAVFTHCLSIESLYYHPDLVATFEEVHRVLAPGGQAYFMVNYFKENSYTHRWASLIKVPVQLLSGDEYCALAREGGFARCRHQTIPDPTPVPDRYEPRHYESKEAMQASRAIGALLVIAEKQG
jgi:ubiquinone/menaquinone biosynthesis C-methylase UbiE